MPIYEEEGKLTTEDLLDLRKKMKCKECGARLDVFMDFDAGKAFLACNDYLRTKHEGIEREASRWEKEGLASLNIITRRKLMEQEHGKPMTTVLDKYIGVVSLTKPQAKEILQAVYPEAPEDEVTRAVLLCASYGLNPLMKHVFLIPFNKGKPNETWATVIGIKAKRLLASRRGNYSYTDNTPRVMTEQEQRAIFGEVSDDKIMVITKVKDPTTGAEAPGYGAWPKDSQPYGTEKGNSKFNMAAIRSESQALDRLRPGEMPVGLEVMPEEAAEAAIEGEFTEVEQEQKPKGEEQFPEHWCYEHNVPFYKRGRMKGWAHIIEGTNQWCNEAKKKDEAPKDEPSPDEPQETTAQDEPISEEQPELDFDSDWLLDSLKRVRWQDATVKSYLKNVYRVDTDGTVVEVVTRLTREQLEAFFKEIQNRLEMV